MFDNCFVFWNVSYTPVFGNNSDLTSTMTVVCSCSFQSSPHSLVASKLKENAETQLLSFNGDMFPKSIVAKNVNNFHSWNHATKWIQLHKLLKAASRKDTPGWSENVLLKCLFMFLIGELRGTVINFMWHSHDGHVLLSKCIRNALVLIAARVLQDRLIVNDQLNGIGTDLCPGFLKPLLRYHLQGILLSWHKCNPAM